MRSRSRWFFPAVTLVASAALAAAACVPDYMVVATHDGSDAADAMPSPDASDATSRPDTGAPGAADTGPADSGADADAETSVPPSLGLMALEDRSTCVSVRDKLYCWGDWWTESGNLGIVTDGGAVSTPTLVEYPNMGLPEQLGMAGTAYPHTCGIFKGTVYCWGSASWDLQGSAVAATGTKRTPPDGIDPGIATGLAVAGGQTCVLTNRTGDLTNVWCFGWPEAGRLGRNGARTDPDLDRAHPIDATALGGLQASSVASGGGTTCVVSSDHKTVYCWGWTTRLQAGPAPSATPCHESSGDIPCVPTPRAMALPLGPGDLFAGVAVGETHACAWTSLGKILCWGDNELDQLGQAAPLPASSCPYANTKCSGPVAVSVLANAAGTRVASVRASDKHTCARFTDGTVQCWGSNEDGRLGNGYGGNVPALVKDGFLVPLTFDDIAVGGGHACARKGQDVFCWGSMPNDADGGPGSDGHPRKVLVP